MLPAKTNGGAEVPDLSNWKEEGDSGIVLHVDWAVRVNHYQIIVALSKYTYTFALLLYCAPDSGVVLHVDWAVRVNHYQIIVVLSKYTDTFVELPLYCAPFLQTMELKEMWQQYGTREKWRAHFQCIRQFLNLEHHSPRQ